MTDHLSEALRLLDWANEPGHTPSEKADEPGALTAALVHAVLDVGEHTEYLGDQLRRLADGVEQVVETLRERLDLDGDATLPGGVDEPCATCRTPRSLHVEHIDGHQWQGGPA